MRPSAAFAAAAMLAALRLKQKHDVGLSISSFADDRLGNNTEDASTAAVAKYCVKTNGIPHIMRTFSEFDW